MRRIISERSVGGLKMQRAIYAWRSGEKLRDYDADLTLKLVSGHHPVRAQCVLDDGRSHSVGRLILTPPDTDLPGIATADETDMRSTIFHIDGDLLNQLLRSCGAPVTADDFRLDLDLHDSQIESGLLRLVGELERESFGSQLIVDALTRMLIVDLARHVTEQQECSAISPGGLRPEQLKHIYAFIDSFEVGLPSPADVAAECGMSPTHLRRLFKRTTGQSLQDHIKGVRIGRAKLLLSDADLPLKVVSYRLGFNHCSAFSFAFQQATGETPGQFRRRRETSLHDARRLDAESFRTAGAGRC